MGDVARSREDCVDLLVRPPQSGWAGEPRVESIVIDPVAQLRKLAALVDDGLLTAEEYDRQRARVLGP